MSSQASSSILDLLMFLIAACALIAAWRGARAALKQLEEMRKVRELEGLITVFRYIKEEVPRKGRLFMYEHSEKFNAKLLDSKLDYAHRKKMERKVRKWSGQGGEKQVSMYNVDLACETLNYLAYLIIDGHVAEEVFLNLLDEDIFRHGWEALEQYIYYRQKNPQFPIPIENKPPLDSFYGFYFQWLMHRRGLPGVEDPSQYLKTALSKPFQDISQPIGSSKSHL